MKTASAKSVCASTSDSSSAFWLVEEKAAECLKCEKDPSYFLTRYGVISHPRYGKTPFRLYDVQKDLLNTIKDNQMVVINKGQQRQIGMSTLVAGFSVWLTVFNQGKSVLILSCNTSAAQKFLEIVKTIYTHTPNWMKPSSTEWKKMEVTFTNGSSVVVSTKATIACDSHSRSLALFVIDEAAYIEDLEDIYTAVLPTVFASGQVIILSTFKEPRGFFYEMCTRVKECERLKKNSLDNAEELVTTAFKYVELPLYHLGQD
jgi:hypothetical protein